MAQRGRNLGARPTLDAVAARAGVGRGTVSRVINGSSQVSARAREAVLRAIEDLGYVPNRAARSLVTRRNDSIALVVSESDGRVFAEPFFAGVVRGVSATLTETQIQLWLTMVSSSDDRARVARHLDSQPVDGVLLLSLHGDDPLPRLMEQSGLPTVLGGRPTGFTPRHYVDIDNRGGARLAVDHLVARGRQCIATVAGPQDMLAGLARLDGYRDGLRAAGLKQDDGLVIYGQFSETVALEAVTDLLVRRPDVDAVFAASDPMGLGAIRAIKAAGRRVPEDIAVVGFDGSPVARTTDPPLSTVHQPAETMGREMTRLLLAQIADGPIEQPAIILAPQLVVRESS